MKSEQMDETDLEGWCAVPWCSEPPHNTAPAWRAAEYLPGIPPGDYDVPLCRKHFRKVIFSDLEAE